MNRNNTTVISFLRKLWRDPTPSRYGKSAGLTAQIVDAVGSLVRTPPKKTFVMCALALTIPATMAIFSNSLKTAEANLQKNRQITVFMDSQVTTTDASILANNLALNKGVKSTTVDTLTIQRKEILTITLQPSLTLNSNDLDFMVKELNSHPTVDFVDADAAWLQQNVAAIKTTKALGILSVVLTALVTSLLAYGITCTDLLRQQTEYRVLNQMGASRSTMLRPYLLRSLLLATVAICTAILLAWGLTITLSFLVDTSTYTGILPASMPLIQMLSLIFIAVFSTIMTVLLVEKRVFSSNISMT